MRPLSPVIQLIAHLGAGGGWVIDVITVHNQVTLSETVLDGLVGLAQSVEKSRPTGDGLFPGSGRPLMAAFPIGPT